MVEHSPAHLEVELTFDSDFELIKWARAERDIALRMQGKEGLCAQLAMSGYTSYSSPKKTGQASLAYWISEAMSENTKEVEA